MKFYRNNEVNDEFCDSYDSIDIDNNKSDFDFDSNELGDYLEVCDENLNINEEEMNSMNVIDVGFTSNSLNEINPISVSREK